ncbi:MAG TPA: hypothetical protein PKC49_11110 [Phycisphaerae bacterium]|nr:hypothetical protein [Phycisphaerae bacterium]
MRTISRHLRPMTAALTLALALPCAAEPPPCPETPATIERLLYVRPFTVERPFQHVWRVEQPEVTRGVLIVAAVKPDLVYPRQIAEPVLYVGRQTARRVNVGYASGRVIAIVPGDVNLETDAIWFGTPRLPEQVDAKIIAQEIEAAQRAGIRPVAGEQLRAARSVEPEALKLADEEALLREAARLILKHAPDEREQAEGLMLSSRKPDQPDKKEVKP